MKNFISYYLKNTLIMGIIFISSVILANNKIYSCIENYIPTLEELIPFSLPIYLALLPIIIAVATFIYQIYYNRYTLKEFKNTIKSEFICLIILSCTELCAIFIYWITKESILFLYFIVLLTLIYLTVKFCFFLFRYNKYSIEGFVNKYTKNSISIIKSKNVSVEDLTILLEGINEYFTESIEKKENNYIRLIINAKREILCEFIKKERELLLENIITKDEDIDLLKIFISSFSRDFRYLYDNDTSKKILSIYANAIIKTLKECILCDNFELYEKIITNLSDNFHFTNRNDFPLNYLIDIFEITYKKNLENKLTDRKYNQLLEDTFAKLFVSIMHEAENSEIEQRIVLANGRIVYFALQTYEESIFETIFEKFINSVIKTIPYLTKKESEILVGMLGNMYMEIDKNENSNLFKIFYKKVFEIIIFSFRNKKELCIEYLGILFHDIIRNNLFIASTENYDEIIKILLNCIRLFPSSSMLFLPDLLKALNNKKNTSKITEISKYIDKIFDGILQVEKYEILHFYLDYLNDCILVFSSEERESQDIFINLYKDILLQSIRTESNVRFEICYSYFKEILEKLDNERNISSNLLETIFNLYDRVGGHLLETNDYSLQSYFLNHLSELPKNLRAIKNKDQKQRITEILFHFSIEMLETKNEKSLRICSNTLGWYAISLEEIGDFESYKITVDSAIHMYTLALEQMYETSTIAFLGTLFIILGAYATVHKSGFSYAEYIKEKVNKLEDSHHIKISKKLRYFESKYWDKTLNDDAKKAISDFYSKLQLKP